MKYNIGLDIGITSVGWAVINIDKNRIEDFGVRLFEVAENPKDGSSLAAPRREARSTRRRLRRRRHRVDRIKNFIIHNELLTQNELDHLFPLSKDDLDVWDLRKDGTDRLLSNSEFARILIHCAKHRGYRSNRKSEEQGDEAGQVLSAVKENHDLMVEKDYRTISHMLIEEERPLRNKGGDYSGVLLRSDIQKEIETIFDKQREFGHPFAIEENKKRYIELWASQRPVASKDEIFNKIGTCSLEKGEKRAPKASYSFSRFRALDRLNRLQIIEENGNKRNILGEERNLVIDQLVNKKSVKYKDLRKLLNILDQHRFSELYYDEKESISKNENKDFISMEDQYSIRQAIKKALGKQALDTLHPIDYDTFGFALTVFKDDQDIKDYLKNEFINSKNKPTSNLSNRTYDDELIDALLTLSFNKFSHLSFKALEKILPFMEQGQLYTEALQSAGYSLQPRKDLPKQRLLPVIPEEEVRNPVVLRALTQSRKVINSIIKKYGSPQHIYIELAREMGRPLKERRQIEKDFNHNRSINEKAKAKIREYYPERSDIRGHDILKMKLWEEQGGQCIYSREPIRIERLLEDGYAQIDHILPYSRSFNDSNHNKVLVLSKENQNKRNETPFEWFGHDETRWNAFVSFVHGLHVSKKKKTNLTNKSFSERTEKEFRDRNLNDTRYITRFLKNFIEEHLHFDSKDMQKVYPVNGAYTAVMRKRWGFNKNRQENSLHHALDAAIVAVSHPFRNRVSAYFKQREESFSQALRKMKIYFPQPWDGFVKEVQIRLKQDSEQQKEAIMKNNLYADDLQFRELVKPIFPSWMPKRSVKGQLHEATFRRNRGKTDEGYTLVVTKIKLENIPFDKKTGDFPMYRKEFDLATYNAIKERYLEFNGDVKKAFEKPLYKPSKNMDNAPIIRSVKIEDKRNRYVSVKGEHMIADNASIARTDVYQDRNTKKFYLLPVYVADVKQGNQPNRFIKKEKPYDKWIPKEDHHEYHFSLFPNDLIYIELPKPKNAKVDKDKKIEWTEGYFYYKGVDTSTGAITISKSNNTFMDRIGVQSLIKFDKYNITPIGDLQKVQKETSYGL